MSAPEVTVVVVSWNTREKLRDCLNALNASAQRGLAEVVVVDNRSSDGSPAMVREGFAWARLVEAGENLGFGRAVNLGADGSRSEWIAASNADVTPFADALETLLAAGRDDPQSAVLAPRLLLEDGATQHSVHRFPTVSLAFLNNLGARRSRRLGRRLLLEGSWDPDQPRRVDWAHGAFLLVRRDAFESVGGFDPEQWMYAEDLDLCWRIAKGGGLTRYVPGARVAHAHAAATAQAFGEERERRSMAASYAWMARRRGRPVALAHALVASFGPLARAAVLALPARVVGGGLAYRYSRARRQAAMHRIGLRPGAAARASAPPSDTLPNPTDGSAA